MKIKGLFCFLFTLICLNLFASDETTRASMKSDLDFIHNSFELYYAPKDWKYKFSGWDLDDEITAAKAKVDSLSNVTTKNYQKIVKEFFQSTKDYHVNVFFHSTESASIPIIIQGTEGRYFIVKLDKNSLPIEAAALQPGDEIVKMDNRPVKDIVNELIDKESNHSNLATDEALAAYDLTHRAASKGHTVPKGSTIIEVKQKGSSNLKKFTLKWYYTPERIMNAFEPKLKEEETDPIKSKLKRLDRKMILPEFALDKSNPEDEMALLAQRKSFIPLLGSKIISVTPDSNPFYAYIYENSAGKKIGYIRLPTFDVEGYDDDPFADFASIISYMQESTDALVIDQINNPGGSAFYLIQLLSILSDKPLKTPTERMMITQDEVDGAIDAFDFFTLLVNNPSYLEGLDLSIDTAKSILKYCSFIISEWNDGRHFTKKIHLMGFDTIQPDSSKTKYSKPILLLVNSLDFSCADFFPAILQDNKRVKILGTRTAGAGGSIQAVKFPNRFGIKFFSYTTSIAERLNSDPIENLGVKPDIEYKLTVDDYQNGFRGYVKAINDAVDKLTKSK